MNVKVLFAYLRMCRENHCTPTWEDLKNYHIQAKAGVKNPKNFGMYKQVERISAYDKD